MLLRRLFLLSPLLVLGCPKGAPRPGKVEVLFRMPDGEPRVGRRKRSEAPCDWELVVVEGRGWATWARTPGPAEIVAGPGGELVAWSTCGTDALTWLVVADSPDLRAQVPGRIEAVAWIDENTVHITGAEPAAAVRFGRDGDGEWVAVPAACVPLGIDASGDTLLDGARVSLLLLEDLDGEGEDEWVVEVPGSCGTARCTAALYTPCAGQGLARPLGTLDHMDGVEALEARSGGWRHLRTRHAEGTDTWQMGDGGYVRME